jgi:putative hydrolase of the HAD superfamily
MWNKNNLLAKPYPEAVEVLESLKDDYKLILIADCDKSFQQILDKFELRKYFSEMVLSYENGLLKSNPEMFKIALKKLKLKPEECLMVGDSIESDIRGAEGAGIKAVLIDRRGRREYENKIFDLKEINQFL